MSDEKSQIYDHISKSEISELKAKLTAYKGTVDFTDDNGKFNREPKKIAKHLL